MQFLNQVFSSQASAARLPLEKPGVKLHKVDSTRIV